MSLEKRLGKTLLAATLAAGVTGCNTQNIKHSPDIMTDNAYIQTRGEPVEMNAKGYAIGLEALKNIMDCEKCNGLRPSITGYDAYDEKGKELALQQYTQKMANMYNPEIAGNHIAEINWQYKTMIATKEMDEWKTSALKWDIGTGAFWTAWLAYNVGHAAGSGNGNGGAAVRSMSSGGSSGYGGGFTN